MQGLEAGPSTQSGTTQDSRGNGTPLAWAAAPSKASDTSGEHRGDHSVPVLML